MKRWMLFGLLLVDMTAQAQTARKFTLDLTDDGKAQMVCFLPQTPSGKAIVGVPGGGYSMLSNTQGLFGFRLAEPAGHSLFRGELSPAQRRSLIADG